jgi:uncharacterized protein (DUF58 family)
MVSRDAGTSTAQELWLDWHASRVPGADAEAQLSRLTAWVLLAEHQGQPYGLRLPGREFEPGHGDAHRRAMLEALALWH